MSDRRSEPPRLSARGLGWSTRRGRRILGPVDLDLHRDESLVVIGPNGAGKTTLLRLLAGLLAPSAGTVELDGRPLATLPRRAVARRIAYVPQLRPARVPFHVEEIVLQGRYPHLAALQLAPREEDFAAVAAALEEVGIADLRHRRLDHLSGGERQSVYLAAALAQEAEILLLDEPTTHLDPRHQRDIAELLLRLHRGGRRSILTVTHDLDFAALLADRVLALRAGATFGDGSPVELLAPERLGELFDAPFEALTAGDRSIARLRIEP